MPTQSAGETRLFTRDSRPDCLQICLGLVVTPDGLPLGYEVFAGNRHDATTLEEIVTKMETKYGPPQPTNLGDGPRHGER